ncbi:MAG: hypothetical protein RDU20_16790 [Desulfomonilaceae bacterium]|nr:hypothetical protein [Desulfomonilaceae bacterium]
MNIAFDVDGVVLRSIEIILHHVNRAQGRNLTPEDLLTWDLEPLGLDEPTLREAVDHMYSQPKIEPYEDARQVLSRIYRMSGKPLLFITGRTRPETALKQLRALPWNPTVPEMIVTGGDRYKRDWLIETSADFIVEDDPEHLRSYLDMGIGVGLMVQPWNRNTDIPVTERFHGWKDLERWYLEVHGSPDRP